MANVKISALDAASTPLDGAEVLPIVQSGVTKKVSVDNLTAGKDVDARSLTVENSVTADSLELLNNAGTESVTIHAPFGLATSYTLTLPNDDGTSGQALLTDGSGTLSWGTPAETGVSSFNTRTGAVTLGSGDVTGALGYTPLAPSAIGTTVEAYDATILKSADIGVTVEGYDATILKSAAIGVTVQGYDADTAKTDTAQTWTATQSFNGVVRLNDADASNYAAIQAPNTLSANYTLTLPADDGTNGQVLSTDGTGVLSWASVGGAGTVTSVDASGGTTGMSFSGGPVTSSGTLTMSGTLAVANGGSGAATLTGILKGNGTSAFSAATAGTDYAATVQGLFCKTNQTIVAFTKTGNGTATTSSVIYVEVNNVILTIASGASITMPTLAAGTDYAIWAKPDGTLEATSNHTSPPVANSRKIGGFHYAPGGNATAQSGGNTTPQINEYSFWDLKFRPNCADPRGMTLVAGGFWMDIYLTGVDAITNGSSKYNVTMADGSSPPKIPTLFDGTGSSTYGSYTWFEAMELATAFGKRCPTQQEFMSAAYGTTEASSVGTDQGSTILNAAYTSKWGVIQSTGVLWVWSRDRGGPFAGASWNANTEGRGSEYSAPNAARLGGDWSGPSVSGSRCSAWNSAASVSASYVGSRFCCDHLQLD